MTLAPCSQQIAIGARWEDGYPAWQERTDELERLCVYLKAQGQLARFLPRLQGRARERDSALNEIRVAFYLDSRGVPVFEWEAPGAGTTVGEFYAGRSSAERVFVEVKGPTWEAELSQEERLAGRTRQPKYLDGDGGAFNNSTWIRFAIDKAYKKFTPDSPNLLVITDDLRVSLRHGTDMFAGEALYDKRGNGYFTHSRYENLSSVGVFWTDVEQGTVRYQMTVYLNPYARGAVCLPDELAETLAVRTL